MQSYRRNDPVAKVRGNFLYRNRYMWGRLLLVCILLQAVYVLHSRQAPVKLSSAKLPDAERSGQAGYDLSSMFSRRVSDAASLSDKKGPDEKPPAQAQAGSGEGRDGGGGGREGKGESAEAAAAGLIANPQKLSAKAEAQVQADADADPEPEPEPETEAEGESAEDAAADVKKGAADADVDADANASATGQEEKPERAALEEDPLPLGKPLRAGLMADEQWRLGQESAVAKTAVEEVVGDTADVLTERPLVEAGEREQDLEHLELGSGAITAESVESAGRAERAERAEGAVEPRQGGEASKQEEVGMDMSVLDRWHADELPGANDSSIWKVPAGRPAEGETCGAFLEARDAVQYLRDFRTSPIRVADSEERLWADCDVGCQFLSHSAGGVDARVQPSGDARAGEEAAVLRSMEPAAYYAINNKDVAHQNGFQLAVVKRYKFSLAFENSCEEDYVTEKFWGSLVVGAVPIVVGAPNIADFAPSPNSYLHIKMVALSKDKEAYEKMLEWKTAGPSDQFKALMDMSAVHSSCRLCVFLADSLQHKEEINQQADRPCRERGRFYFSSLFMRGGAITLEGLKNATLDAFGAKKHQPVWWTKRPKVLVQNISSLRIYRMYPAASTQKDALYRNASFRSDEQLRQYVGTHPCPKLEVIFI
eukprot:jgi/Mesen1/1620/ME000135S00615